MTLIDAGFRSGVPRIMDFIAGLGRKPEELRLIILTHNHVDHIGGLRDLVKRTGAKVACHRADIYDLRGAHAVPARLSTAPFRRGRSRRCGRVSASAPPRWTSS